MTPTGRENELTMAKDRSSAATRSRRSTAHSRELTISSATPRNGRKRASIGTRPVAMPGMGKAKGSGSTAPIKKISHCRKDSLLKPLSLALGPERGGDAWEGYVEHGSGRVRAFRVEARCVQQV